MITFKQQFTVKEEVAKEFAKHLLWQEKVTQVVSDNGFSPNVIEVDNPVTYIEYIEEKSREHSLKFTKSWAESLVQKAIDEQTDQIRPVIEAQIVKPVEEALISEVVTE